MYDEIEITNTALLRKVTRGKTVYVESPFGGDGWRVPVSQKLAVRMYQEAIKNDHEVSALVRGDEVDLLSYAG